MLEIFLRSWYNHGMDEYTVVRSARKTLCLQLTKEGEVVVKAPFGIQDADIADFVERHQSWLERKKREFQRVSLDLSDGCILPLFGKEFSIATGRARIVGNILYLPEKNRERALILFLKKCTLQRMTMMTESLAEDFGLRFQRVRVSSARGRWGSCNAENSISYSFRTAFLPGDCAHYLCAHELAHTLHHDHSPAFWKEVERMAPDWKIRRKELKKYAWCMNIL